MLNEYGMKLDRNGYARSVLQDDTCRCCRCGRTDRKLDRHEVFGGANRQKSKALGLWVTLCHEECHLGAGGVHQDAALRKALRAQSQQIAMGVYGWTEEAFVRRFGRSYTADDAEAEEGFDGEDPEEEGAFCLVEEAELPW